jgi:hypothetical protein
LPGRSWVFPRQERWQASCLFEFIPLATFGCRYGRWKWPGRPRSTRHEVFSEWPSGCISSQTRYNPLGLETWHVDRERSDPHDLGPLAAIGERCAVRRRRPGSVANFKSVILGGCDALKFKVNSHQ